MESQATFPTVHHSRYSEISKITKLKSIRDMVLDLNYSLGHFMRVIKKHTLAHTCNKLQRINHMRVISHTYGIFVITKAETSTRGHINQVWTPWRT